MAKTDEKKAASLPPSPDQQIERLEKTVDLQAHYINELRAEQLKVRNCILVMRDFISLLPPLETQSEDCRRRVTACIDALATAPVSTAQASATIGAAA